MSVFASLMVSSSLFLACEGFILDRKCTKEEKGVIYAIALGDTVVLDDYLKTRGIYNVQCRHNVDFLRPGDSMIRQLGITTHASVYRTYLKYPVPQEILDELLYGRFMEDHPSEILRLLIARGAKLETFSQDCNPNKAPNFLPLLDTLDYDFHWTSPNKGNNILMDYCGCMDITPPFQDEFNWVIRFLVNKGVRMDIKNHRGETAIDIAKRSGVIDLLREAERERK